MTVIANESIIFFEWDEIFWFMTKSLRIYCDQCVSKFDASYKRCYNIELIKLSTRGSNIFLVVLDKIPGWIITLSGISFLYLYYVKYHKKNSH